MAQAIKNNHRFTLAYDQERPVPYDQERPVRGNYVHSIRSRQSISDFELINSRSDGRLVEEISAKGIDLDNEY